MKKTRKTGDVDVIIFEEPNPSNQENDTTAAGAGSRPKRRKFEHNAQLQEEVSRQYQTRALPFTTTDFAHLALNESYRYVKNSKRVGHAVIIKDKKNIPQVFHQYSMPYSREPDALEVVELHDIKPIRPYGLLRYSAKTLDDKTMYAKRVLKAKIKKMGEEEIDVDIAYFSEDDKPKPFWGGKNKNVTLLNPKLDKKHKRELEQEQEEIGEVFKGGFDLEVNHHSVFWREEYKNRSPDQNTVMGESAKDAYLHFLEMRKDDLSKDFKKVLGRAIDAPLNGKIESNYRPEWLHAYGFSLSPASYNPQIKSNLGAAAKWSNTEMMVTERIAKWYAMHREQAKISLNSKFKMLYDSELVENIDFKVKLAEHGRSIEFHQDIYPLAEYPMFRKASDLAQTTCLTVNILEGHLPLRTSGNMNYPSLLRTDKMSKTPDEPSAAGGGKSPAATSVSSSSPRPLPKKTPTALSQSRSVVQILTTSQVADYDNPWRGIEKTSSTGTGLVIENAGKKYIVTNAHVVENSLIIRVRLSNERKKKYEAKCLCVSYQADLALLEVNDQHFNQATQAADIGPMVELETHVNIVGFPMGGEEISITKGIVSRIEVSEYAQSECDMLQVQVDAAINPGNSGGPVFSNGQVVGIAFQGYGGGQNLGYMIPTPIVSRFLQEAFSKEAYRGFPILPMTVQTLENAWLRKHYGMQKHDSGIRIQHIDKLSNAYLKLRENDIILEIDGLKMSNEGTVDIPEIGNCISFLHVTHMKPINDSITLKILRKPKHGEADRLDVKVTLDAVPFETSLIAAKEYDCLPRYYISSGIAFVPLTRNYLEGRGADLESIHTLEHDTDLPNAGRAFHGQELVVINDVLDCKETESYDEYVNEIVSRINGHKIDNFKDVIAAMDLHLGPVHTIETKSKKIIVVKNMSEKQHAKLLEHYQIPSDRSRHFFSPILSTLAEVGDSLITEDSSKEGSAYSSQEMEFAAGGGSSKLSSAKKASHIYFDDKELDESSSSAQKKSSKHSEHLSFQNSLKPRAASSSSSSSFAAAAEIDDDIVDTDEDTAKTQSRLVSKKGRLDESSNPNSTNIFSRKRRIHDDEDLQLQAPMSRQQSGGKLPGVARFESTLSRLEVLARMEQGALKNAKAEGYDEEMETDGLESIDEESSDEESVVHAKETKSSSSHSFFKPNPKGQGGGSANLPRGPFG